jgi:hypothetical protein
MDSVEPVLALLGSGIAADCAYTGNVVLLATGLHPAVDEEVNVVLFESMPVIRGNVLGPIFSYNLPRLVLGEASSLMRTLSIVQCCHPFYFFFFSNTILRCCGSNSFSLSSTSVGSIFSLSPKTAF